MSYICSFKFLLIVFIIFLQNYGRPAVIPEKIIVPKDEKSVKINESSSIFFVDKLLLPKMKKKSDFLSKKTLIDFINITKNDFKPVEIKKQSLNTKLLADDELKTGEVLKKPDKEAADVITKYGNGMFGLADAERDLHVWRAPFASLGEIWPHPWSTTRSNNIFTICPTQDSLYFKVTGIDNYVIQHAITRCKNIICGKSVSVYPSNWREQERLLDEVITGEKIFRTTKESLIKYFDHSHFYSATYKGPLTTVHIFVGKAGHSWPSLYMNESYHLSVTRHGVFIEALETWGALRAMESLSQLVWRTRSGRVFINETKIIDQPRFKHRGMMLDTARHFLPKSIILKNLDAMAMNKFNVFHWHISDDQSFPLVTENHPELAKFGSYDFETKVYRPEDVREIVEYARLRGIRVIPEIDSPSHSLSWRKSHPEVMTRCVDQYGVWTGYYGPLNMAATATYRLLKGLFTDIVHMFPDQWIHLGSDEVPSSCVLGNPAIQRWMQSIKMPSMDTLTDFYTRKLQNIITEIGQNKTSLQRGFIVWQEAYDRNSALKNDTIVQIWKGSSTLDAALVAQRKLFVIYSACWYLDRLEYGAQWAVHYMCDPGDDQGAMGGKDDFWRQYILGGEVAMWLEFFDADNVLPRIWPLANAAAERLWSPGKHNDVNKAAPRIEEMRCRMLIRSIPVGVASGAGDCGQGSESSQVDFGNHDNAGKPIIFLADASSLRLLYQILYNLLSRTVLIVLLLAAVVICISHHRQLHLSKQRVMLIVMVVLGFYSLFWIVSQQMLLLS